jgi:PAS domain S-box-containing protein
LIFAAHPEYDAIDLKPEDRCSRGLMPSHFKSSNGLSFSNHIGATLSDIDQAEARMPDPQSVSSGTLLLDASFVNALYNGLTEAILAVQFGTRTIVHWNKGAEAMFGYTAREVLGKTTEIIYPDQYSFEKISRLARPTIRQQGAWQTEWEYKRRDGSCFPADVIATMIESSEGSQFYVIVIRDISAKKRAEAALAAQSAFLLKFRQRLQVFLEHTTMLIYIAGSDGRLGLINKRFEELFHVSAAGIAGTSLHAVFDDETADMLIENNAKVIAAKSTMRFEEIIPQADGLHTYVSVKVPFYDENGTIYAVCAACTDITERKRDQETIQKLNEELEYRVAQRTAELETINERLRQEIASRRQAEEKLLENERMATIGVTSAKLAHEIANPLQIMVTAVELLEQCLNGKGDIPLDMAKSVAHDLRAQVNLLLNFLGEFKDITRPTDLQLRSMNAVSLVHELLTLEGPHYAKLGIRVEEDLAEHLPPIDGDPVKLNRAFLNLFKNAVEAMPRGGTLKVRAYQENSAVVLEVSDTGVGIPKDINVFDLFVTSKPMGTGLGLPIVQDIVNAHHGAISYTSDCDKGTTFKLKLPLLTTP